MDELLTPSRHRDTISEATSAEMAKLSKEIHSTLHLETGEASHVQAGTTIYKTLDTLEPDGLRHYRRMKAKVSVAKSANQIYHAIARSLVVVNTFVKKPAMVPVYFLVAALCIAAGASNTVYTTGYEVTVNGQDIGVVADYTTVDNTVKEVESRASAILGYDYTLNADVSYDRVVTERSKVTNSISGLETYLFSQVGDVMKSYVLTVDGTAVGALSDRSKLDALLDQIAAPYLNENTTSHSFTQDVSISYDYVSNNVLQDYDKIAALLTSNKVAPTTYVVQSGDTYYDLAWQNGMTVDELLALNPSASIDHLHAGDVLTLNASVPYLTVTTTENVSYTEAIACPVQEVSDSSMYVGNSKVINAGVEGQAQVNADVTYVNGVESTRNVLSYNVISNATTEVVAVGSAERPTWAASGSFRWPVSGEITSYFGYRSIFGSTSYHSGIDIATAYGTAIAAADGGTVTWTGYKGSYGNLVIIDHGNGYQTYYGHCSSISVSVGDKVYKGQTIARVGSTGRSTGNHCHFEVRYNGTSCNPLKYLP